MAISDRKTHKRMVLVLVRRSVPTVGGRDMENAGRH
jgi:hypothetical protein